MKTLLIALLITFGFVHVRAAEEVVGTSEPQTVTPSTVKTTDVPASSAKKKAQAKKKSSKKPVEKTVIAAPIPAADRKTSMNQGLQEWLAKMKKRVSASRAKQNKLVAVAAVRGDEKSDPPPLYWKGKEGEKAVNALEMDAFNAAVDTAMKGDSEAAKTQLQQFVTIYPQSPLVPEANETIAKLSVTESDTTQPDASTAP